jgi:hypothetical protein
MHDGMSGLSARTAGVVAALLLAIGGCGGGDDDGDGGSSDRQAEDARAAAEELKEAVEKTEAAGTARIEFDISVTGAQSATVTGEGRVDFEHDRDLITVTADGQTLQLFSDRGKEYVRQGTSGRYQPFPASADSPVANNPADSLRYVGTDVVDVTKENGCFKGSLDFDRVFERVEAGREAEFPEQLRGKKAPVTVCVDGAGRIRQYDVELDVSGAEVVVRSTLSDHGRAPALHPLGPDERPQ